MRSRLLFIMTALKAQQPNTMISNLEIGHDVYRINELGL